MSTPAQISANIANAKLSSGPRTDTGKATSAKNGITLGLFTSGDFVRPSEREAYASLQAQLNLELAPVGVLETTLVEEIRRATWKLRRCGEVEANLAPSADDATSVDETTPDPLASDDARAEKIQRSVDRARAQAHRLLHKCTAELRKLQAGRQTSQPATQTESTARPTPQLFTVQTQSGSIPQPAQTPRNADCPCGSGLKHKRCCGKSAPPVLHAA